MHNINVIMVCGPNRTNIAKPLQYIWSQILAEMINRIWNNVETVTWFGTSGHVLTLMGQTKWKLKVMRRLFNCIQSSSLFIRNGYLFCYRIKIFRKADKNQFVDWHNVTRHVPKLPIWHVTQLNQPSWATYEEPKGSGITGSHHL